MDVNKIIFQPPQNSKTLWLDISSLVPYSARKNIAKTIELYSTLYPATNSASASGKSKGVRLVSAILAIKNICLPGKLGLKNQTVVLCMATILVKFNDPASITTGSKIRLLATS